MQNYKQKFNAYVILIIDTFFNKTLKVRGVFYSIGYLISSFSTEIEIAYGSQSYTWKKGLSTEK